MSGCGPRADQQASSAESWPPALIDTLVRFGREDQSGREAIPQAIAANDTAVLLRFMRADTARSVWLRRLARERGWPSRTTAGDSAAQAAWFILDHSPFHDWQEEMLPTLEQLADRKEVRWPDVALLTDRVLVHRGQPQRYGSQFSTINGKLVPDSIADLQQLDARRAAVGLMPMAEYARMLGEMYKLPVVWPPGR